MQVKQVRKACLKVHHGGAAKIPSRGYHWGMRGAWEEKGAWAGAVSPLLPSRALPQPGRCSALVWGVCVQSSTNWLQLCHVNGALCLEAVGTVWGSVSCPGTWGGTGQLLCSVWGYRAAATLSWTCVLLAGSLHRTQTVKSFSRTKSLFTVKLFRWVVPFFSFIFLSSKARSWCLASHWSSSAQCQVFLQPGVTANKVTFVKSLENVLRRWVNKKIKIHFYRD